MPDDATRGRTDRPTRQANPVDDVFNSVPFLLKRKESMEKEMASIDEQMAALTEQYSELEGEWGDKVCMHV